jgi:hypothetical protein
VEHTPAYTQVPPADSIGRHLCEVACSCGLFHMTASSAQAAAAYADAEHAFEGHRERASHAAPVPLRRVPQPETAAAATPARPRRRAAYVAAAGAAFVVLGVVLAVLVIGRGDPEYAGAPTLVGGPDRTGPAVLDPGDAEPASDDDPLTRENGYAELRAVAPQFVSWTELQIDHASAEVCRLLDAGRSIREAPAALVEFAEAFDC